ncbi:hypothetical protein, partial [Novosphingobium clariflavum]
AAERWGQYWAPIGGQFCAPVDTRMDRLSSLTVTGRDSASLLAFMFNIKWRMARLFGYISFMWR